MNPHSAREQSHTTTPTLRADKCGSSAYDETGGGTMKRLEATKGKPMMVLLRVIAGGGSCGVTVRCEGIVCPLMLFLPPCPSESARA